MSRKEKASEPACMSFLPSGWRDARKHPPHSSLTPCWEPKSESPFSHTIVRFKKGRSGMLETMSKTSRQDRFRDQTRTRGAFLADPSIGMWWPVAKTGAGPSRASSAAGAPQRPRGTTAPPASIRTRAGTSSAWSRRSRSVRRNGKVFASLAKHIPHSTAITPKGCVYDQNRQQPPYLPSPQRRRADRHAAGPAHGPQVQGPPERRRDFAQRPTPEIAAGTTLRSFYA